MARTQVRTARRSYAFARSALDQGHAIVGQARRALGQVGALATPSRDLQPERDGALPSWLHHRAPSADRLLALFISVQSIEFAMLGFSERLDLPVALCLSAGLLTVARLFTLVRSDVDSPTVTARALCEPAKAEPADVTTQQHDVTAANIVLSSRPYAVAIPGGPAEESRAWADLMARVSHEIRTPLNAVIGFSDLMGREIFGPLGHGAYRDYATHIKESGETLLKSAEDTLALSALLATPNPDERIESSDLSCLVTDACRSLASTVERRGITIGQIASGPLDVSGDRRAYRQVVMNLVTEAVQRAADSSLIEVRVTATRETARLTVTVAKAVPRREVLPSLAMCVAQALLERLGTPLWTQENAGSWQAAVAFDLVNQPDFFAACPVDGRRVRSDIGN